ncbi:MAG: apolipoprotein N-acyltransferase [Spirochaetales bacterium]|nr:apolipoprotein N-acyltransferase [Spirochaetales bacterium]
MTKRIIKKLAWFIAGLALILFSSIFTSYAFPSEECLDGYGLWIFIAFIPTFIVINKSKQSVLWFYGLVYGYVFFTVYGTWLAAFHPMANYIVSILASLQYMLLFPAVKIAGKLVKKRGYIVQSLTLSLYYYLTLQGFLGFPYGTPAAALWNHTALIQSASIFGIWGITVLILLPQAMIAEMIVNKTFYKKDVLIYIIGFVMNLSIGYYTIGKYERTEADRTIRVAALQHSADTWEGGYSTYTKNFRKLRDMSLEALKENPDFIVWSETAFVPSVAWHKAYPTAAFKSNLCNEFVNFGKSLPVPLITGNPESVIKDPTLPAILEDGSWNEKTYNTVILFGDGEILGTYRKQRLVPFTENFPYEEELPRLHAFLLSHNYNWWEKGEEPTVFEYDGIKFATPICFEDTFGYLSAEFAQNGADILINLSNDSWSGSIAAEMQHMQLALFRAIENRIPLVRSTNSGITCHIDETGRVHGMLDPFTVDWTVYEVELGKYDSLTFYTKHPDLLPKAIIALLIILLLMKARTEYATLKYARMTKLALKEEKESRDNINAEKPSTVESLGSI